MAVEMPKSGLDKTPTSPPASGDKSKVRSPMDGFRAKSNGGKSKSNR